MDPVEIYSNNVSTNASSSTTASVPQKITNWVCGNSKCLNDGGFCASTGGGMFFEATKSSETISKTADELLAANIMGKVAKTAKWVGYTGDAINMAVAISNYYQNPTGYNLGKLIVTESQQRTPLPAIPPHTLSPVATQGHHLHQRQGWWFHS